MNRRLTLITSIIGIIALAAIIFPLKSVEAESGHVSHGDMDMKTHLKVMPLTLEKIHL